MGPAHLDRLGRTREVLSRRDDLDLSDCRLAYFSAQGFTAELTEGQHVPLVDLDRLYTGS